MIERLSEMIEMLLVNLGIALSKLTDEQSNLVTYFLASLLMAAAVAHVLHAAVR